MSFQSEKTPTSVGSEAAPIIDFATAHLEGAPRPDLASLEAYPFELPEEVDALVATEIAPTIDFAQAVTLWQAAFDGEQLKSSLRAQETILLARQDLTSYRYIKDIRKKAFVLIGAWTFLDREHQTPPTLLTLAKLLGKIKDEKVSLKKKKRLIARAIDTIDALIVEESDHHFEPSDTESVLQYYNAAIAEIRKLILLPVFTQAQYHELRKQFRLLDQLYGLISIRLPHSPIEQVQKLSYFIHSRMGETQDTFVDQQQFEGVDKHTTHVTLEPRYRDRIELFLQHHPETTLYQTGIEYNLSHELPDKFSSDYVNASYHPETVFTEAKEEWESLYKPEEITQLVNSLTSGSLSKPDQKAFALRIKYIRKAGIRLESVWKLVNSAEPFPRSLALVLESLGELKDHFKSNKRIVAVSEKLQQRMLALESEWNQVSTFAPAPSAEFQERYQTILTYCDEMLQRQSWTPLEHHRVRWRFRRIVHYFQVLAKVTQSPEVVQIHQYLETIANTMGKEQGQMQKMEHKGLLTANQRVLVQPALRQLMHQFIDQHSEMVEQTQAEQRTYQVAGKAVPLEIQGENKTMLEVMQGSEQLDANELLARFSRLKYGDLAEVEYFAKRMCESALANQEFIAFLERARDQEAQVYITSPGIYNVPSASNLLLRAVATHLNVALGMTANLPTLICTDQTRVGESSLHYASQGLAQRGAEKHSRSITPAKFADQFVIFVDDIVISGTVAHRATENILGGAGAKELFQLFAAQVDPRLVSQTDGKIEDVINRYQITGSIASLMPILLGEFEPVQKLLRDFLKPENRSELAEFLPQVPNTVLLKLFRAALSNDFYRRYEGLYAPSLDIVMAQLRSCGLLDSQGHLTK